MRNVDPYRRQLIELQNHGDGFSFEGKPSNSRSKRATTGQPVASAPYILRGDNHRFANVHYSGDESDVSICIDICASYMELKYSFSGGVCPYL